MDIVRERVEEVFGAGGFTNGSDGAAAAEPGPPGALAAFRATVVRKLGLLKEVAEGLGTSPTRSLPSIL